MTDPTVSVVIPAYNAGRHVGVAVESALRQTCLNLEVIVIDDGSIDETAAILHRIRDPRLRVIRQDNQGQSAAINKGVEHARGEYIKLLDADDWLNPVHIASQLHAIESSPERLASCLWGYFTADPANISVRKEHTNRNYDDSLEWLVDSLTLDEGMMGGWMWLIPRRLWESAGGFDPRLSLNNDFHFSIKLLLVSEGVSFAGDAVYGYRKGNYGALSGSSGRRAMESAYLTTLLGTECLLQRENSPRIRKIGADRFQHWLFRFYPEYPDLSIKASQKIDELGGSELEMQGGSVLQILQPVIGWKGVRQLQRIAYWFGWQKVLKYKSRTRRALLG